MIMTDQDITVRMATQNKCYKQQNFMPYVQGEILHDNGCASPSALNWAERQFTSSRNLVHYWIDEDYFVQCAPDIMKCWHVGNRFNSTHIGTELSPKNKSNPADFYGDPEHFNIMWERGVANSARLAIKHGYSAYNIYSHKEAHAISPGNSNHGDTDRWFSRHGTDMDDYREDVCRAIGEPIRVYTSFKVNNASFRLTLAIWKDVDGVKKYDGSFRNGTIVELISQDDVWLYGQVIKDHNGNDVSDGRVGYFDLGYMKKHDFKLVPTVPPATALEELQAEYVVLTDKVGSITEVLTNVVLSSPETVDEYTGEIETMTEVLQSIKTIVDSTPAGEPEEPEEPKLPTYVVAQYSNKNSPYLTLWYDYKTLNKFKDGANITSHKNLSCEHIGNGTKVHPSGAEVHVYVNGQACTFVPFYFGFAKRGDNGIYYLYKKYLKVLE